MTQRYHNRTGKRVDIPLCKWMDENGYTNSSLADELGMSHAAIYKVTSGERDPGDSFKWRFARRFGMFVAKTLFEDREGRPLPYVSLG